MMGTLLAPHVPDLFFAHSIQGVHSVYEFVGSHALALYHAACNTGPMLLIHHHGHHSG